MINNVNVFHDNKKGTNTFISISAIKQISQAGKRSQLTAKASMADSVDVKPMINGVYISSLNAEYVQIMGVGKFLSTQLIIQLDFGQYDNLFTGYDTRLTDQNDNAIVFNSMVDALNFMCKHGYEFVQAYAFSTGTQNVYHYLLRRKKK